MDEEVQYEWARIPHFYRPFYVYKYATGYTSAVALSEAVRTKGPEAVSRYLEFLSMGGSADPLNSGTQASTSPARLRCMPRCKNSKVFLRKQKNWQQVCKAAYIKILSK